MSEEARATQRPLIVVFTVISFALGGVIASVLAAGLQLGLGIAEGIVPSMGMQRQVAGLVVALGAVLLDFTGIFSIAAAYGLWTRQRWGRSLALALLLASLVIGCLGLLANLFSRDRSLGSFFTSAVGIAVSAFLFMRLSVLRDLDATAAAQAPAAEKLFCTHCGATVRAGSVACSQCGNRL